jgi:NAD(P)-dependent dehydrogenase (short-subunit alcohol dehydrogenase family)
MKSWFVTGISRGLGLAIAKAALARGDTVVGTVRGTRPELEAPAGKLQVLTVDMADGTAVAAAVKQAFALAGRLDVIVNNAGYGLLGALESASDAEVSKLFAVDVFAPMNVIRTALPYLRKQGSGHIINVTSIAGRAPNAGSAAYAAAKSALEALSQSLAQEVAPLGIKVTAVAPGAFRTDFLAPSSIARSEAAAGDYASTATNALAVLDTMHGKQVGDPDLAAAAFLKLVDSDKPPLHLLLGSDALRRARAKLDTLIEEMNEWETLTLSTDYK